MIRGSAGVYGAEPNAPQFFTEDMVRLFPLRTRFQRDVAEIEHYFEAHARRHPHLTCTMLRYQPAIGPSLDSQVTRYLSLPACPTYLGFDPRIQLVHSEDALDALVAAVKRPVRGAVNVAGTGTIGLARMLRLAGRPHLPLAAPLFGPAAGAAERLGVAGLSDDFRRLLRYGRGVDTRRLVEEIGFRPRHSTVAAVRGLGGGRGRMTDPGAITFLRRMREGLDAGLELPEALARAAGALPREGRETVNRALRRLEGDYPEDEWGFDEDFADLVEPFFGFLYERWWRVQTEGVEHVPSHGRALLVANHAGILPWDATMISMALLREHPLPRHPRFLVLDWAFDLPWVSSALRKVGGVVAVPQNAHRLLEQERLVAVFPEGVKGTGKPYAERYRLQRFGRGGFVEIALRSGAPIVPVAVVGSEEIYPKLGGRARACPPDRRALLPGHPHLSLAGAARPGPASVALADRLPRAHRHQWAGPGGGRRSRPGAGVVGTGPRDHPGGAARRPPQARFQPFLTCRSAAGACACPEVLLP